MLSPEEPRPLDPTSSVHPMPDPPWSGIVSLLSRRACRALTFGWRAHLELLLQLREPEPRLLHLRCVLLL